MQGSCNSEPSAADLNLEGTKSLDWATGQCVIVTDAALMTVVQNLWLHGLYLRYHRTTRFDQPQSILSALKGAKLWLTDVTLQGEGIQDPFVGSLWVFAAELYTEGANQ